MPVHSISLSSPIGRLTLVPATAADDEAVAILRSHPTTLRYLEILPEHVSVEDVRKRRESRDEDETIVDFLMKSQDGKLAGMCGLFHIEKDWDSCEVGILVSPDCHRGGYATEALYMVLKYAFEDRQFNRATFSTGLNNVGMRGWCEMAGATHESTWRQYWKNRDGSYADVVGYSILAHEWEATKEVLEARMRR
jgi:RimJ/RimL family protein N-acetyltransferase